MIFKFITKAKELLYDNKTSGLSATNTQDAIDELKAGADKINNNLSSLLYSNVYSEYRHIQYMWLDQTLGTDSNSKPWLELKAQYANLPVQTTIVGTIHCGAACTFIGMKISDLYGGFLVIMYGYMYHVSLHGGTWFCKELAAVSASDAF